MGGGGRRENVMPQQHLLQVCVCVCVCECACVSVYVCVRESAPENERQQKESV